MGKRLYSMDLIRVIAMVLVIIVHTKYYFFMPNAHSSIYAVLKVIGTVGVPLFVILTGYLMFDRNYEDEAYLKKYLSHNLLPLFTAYEFWNIAWNVLRYTHVVENPQKWSAVLKAAFFMGDTLSALWYLPMTIALYLGMPILSMACHRIKSSCYQKILMIALILSGTLIPSVAPIVALTGHKTAIHSVLRMNIFGASVWGESVWMIYLLSGWAIYKGKLKPIKTSLLATVGTIVPLGIMYLIQHTNKYNVQHYDFILVVILSISTFELLTRTEYFLQNHEAMLPIISTISKISFGVYMMHIFIGGGLFQLLKLCGLINPIGKIFSGPIGIAFYLTYIICIIIIAQGIIVIFKKYNILRQYVFLMK